MRKVKFEYYCDICKIKLNMSDFNSVKDSVHIEDDELTTVMDDTGKSGISYYREWDLCPKCFKEKFNNDRNKALKYFKSLKED